MTKLEELKADAEAARDATEDAYYAARDAVGPDGAEIWDAKLWAAYAAAREAYHAAWDAYWAELKKTQEENSND
jgi:hypothetical protein